MKVLPLGIGEHRIYPPPFILKEESSLKIRLKGVLQLFCAVRGLPEYRVVSFILKNISSIYYTIVKYESYLTARVSGPPPTSWTRTVLYNQVNWSVIVFPGN